MVDLISGIVATRTKAEKEGRILDRLKSPGIRRRENAVEPARAGTYRWLLYPPLEPSSAETPSSDRRSSSQSQDKGDIIDVLRAMNKWAVKNAQFVPERDETNTLKAETWARFLSWLESGSGIFYISGKPGSGKSTIMKFLVREERTTSALKSWAAGKQLAFASFFFWSSGLGLQRSIEGLYRGLLWEALRTCPELIPTVFPHMWDNDSDHPPVPPSNAEFFLRELEEAFARLTGCI